MSWAPVLKVKNLSTYFYTRYGVIKAVNGASFTVAAGKTLGLVGESGCGKSVTALSILRLIEPPGRICSGEVWLNGCDLLKIPPRQLRQVRGREIALVFQDPLTSLNPVLTIGTQLAETIDSHEEISRAEARRRAVELLFRLGLPDPERLMRLYPFQLSGGMRQRVMVAMALALRPKVLIADEPTTALDVTVQAQILAELKRLQEELGMAIVLITHDLGVVAAMTDEVAVMYAGTIVEHGPVAEVFDRPAHPYTRALLRSVPRLGREELAPVEGQPPSLLNLPAHCAFLPRCLQAGAACRGEKPELREIGPGHAAACHRLFPWAG
ncbi:MAG: ABC transporter ATP-binding protein [Armatimonadetes bacterium]|nr:ABC transporter ATP-binding protein [Armatimonadota bacterium]